MQVRQVSLTRPKRKKKKRFGTGQLVFSLSKKLLDLGQANRSGSNFTRSTIKQNLQSPFDWNSGKVRRQKMVGEWKSERIENILISPIFVWLGVEKWRDGKSVFVYV